MKVLIAADRFVTAEVWKQHLREALPDFKLQFIVEESAWPDEPFLLGEEVNEYLGSEKRLAELARDVEVIVTQLAPITRRVLDSAKNLKIIGCSRTGPVNINAEEAAKRGIPVIYAPGRNSSAVAEFTVGLILAEVKNICRAHVDLKKGVWRGDFYRYDMAGQELSQMQVGLIGLGAIGVRMVPLLKAFGCKIMVFDPYVSESYLQELDLMPVSLEDLLRTADIVSLHARVTEETKGMIGKAEFEMMKPSAYFVNTARGPLVDYSALYDALAAKQIAGAALDCFAIEPVPEGDPLLKLENCTITPHIAGSSKHTAHTAAKLVCNDLANFFAGRELNNNFVEKA